MGDWMLPCECCRRQIKKIRNADNVYESFNMDGSPHQKHYKVWASAVASFEHFGSSYAQPDPSSKVGDLTVEQLSRMMDTQINLKFGKYLHRESGFKEIWLTPRKFVHGGTDYYVSGTIDGIEGEKLVELKTTWYSSKAMIQSVIRRAETQADIYAWVAGYKEAKIIIMNIPKPELDQTVHHLTQPDRAEGLLAEYIQKNKDAINQY